MPAVTGPPPEMAESRGDLTPMMRQYFELTAEYDDCLVLFQVGDFYEAFCDAAEEVSKVLEVTLTQREDSTGTYRMAGIPIDNAASYVEGLLDAGYRVAVADQVEDPDEASGVVDRAVTRVVTPGTVTDDELLAGSATYLACLARETTAERTNGASADPADATHAVAFLDVSTGEFRVTSVESRRRASEELDRVGPAEVVFAPEFADASERDDEPDIGDEGDGGATGDTLAETFDLRATTTVYDPEAFDTDSARERVGRYVAEPDSVLATDAELRACGGLLAYAEYTQGDGVRGDVPEEPAAVGVSTGGAESDAPGESADPTDADPTLGYVTRIRRYDPDDALRLDPTAIRSLELFENRTREDGPTLLGVVDDTASALGRRRLESWLRRPLLDTGRIDARQSAVAEFSEVSLVRAEVRELLESVYDVERLLGRVARSRANARDLRSLKTTLDTVPELKSALEPVESERLLALRERLDELADVRGLIDDAIHDDPPAEITEGGIIASGYDDELDDLRETEQSGREWVADLEAKERDRTGIDSLSVGYNQVHGYYIEVTKPNLDRVPDDYTRRQTLKNSERFYTPELKRREDEIIGAAERADSLEYDLFRDVRREVAEEAERVQDVADALAELDTLATLAEVAVAHDWTRPEVVDYDTERVESADELADESAPAIDIEGGRHPVVADAQERFVPNDTHLGDSRIAVVTGPNMSGKSTYMRQVALICILAQVGSFVPADAARLPTLDRIFTRVGASDDIAGGQSTFMREMSELTDILHDATERSLILLDEVGRGTSTTDGLSIAWATTEFVHDEIGAFTLFATHYHELTAIADDLPGVTNLHFAADRDDSGVTFRHEVREGPASSSYGVEVAGLAGVPDPVVGRSRALVERGGPGGHGDENRVEDADTSADDDSESGAGGIVQATLEGDPVTDAPDSASADADASTPAVTDETVADLLAELREIDVADTTPLEALNRLHDLRELADADR